MAASHGKKLTLLNRCVKSLAENELPYRRVYGRRKGKPLSVSRAAVMDTLYPKLSLTRNTLKQDRATTPEMIFGAPVKTLHFEIGFGGGEHLAWQMEKNPADHFIGAEIFSNGVASLLKHVNDIPHENLRVLMDDALIALNSLPDACIDYLYILNPDPWPKARHHHRRIVVPENLDVYARVLKPGGILLETTDVAELSEWMADHTENHPAFDFVNKNDIFTPSEGWEPTRYENKGKAAGRRQTYLLFKRKTGQAD